MIRVSRSAGSWLLLLVLLALLASVATGCTSRPSPNAPEPDRPARVEASADAFSVYDLAGTWHDQTGAVRSLGDWRGTPVLVALIYMHCTATCPLAVSELKRIAALDPHVRFVLVSLDPARDDVRRLAGYAAERGLDPARWTLLTGADTDLRDLAATLGVRYRQVTPGDLAHSNLITLLDSEGRIARQSNGQLDAAAITELHALAR
jgi:protein SCO1